MTLTTAPVKGAVPLPDIAEFWTELVTLTTAWVSIVTEVRIVAVTTELAAPTTVPVRGAIPVPAIAAIWIELETATGLWANGAEPEGARVAFTTELATPIIA